MFVGLVEGTLSARETLALEDHLDRCPACAGIVAELAQAPRGGDGAPTESTASANAPGDKPRLIAGQQLGRYTILEMLGEGGMGVVYSAYDARLDRRVALKFMLGSGTPRERERLRVEARALAQLAHPNVLTIHDIDEHEGDLFITAQYVEGASVDLWLVQSPRSPEDIVAVFVQAGKGLAAAHGRKLVHRDVKPSNLLVDERGRVFVADFGLAQSTSELTDPTTGTGDKPPVATNRAGTPTYMAPEQLRGDPVDATADQYSFCVALYEALLGRHPFASSADRARPPEGLSQLPRRLARALARGLSKNPADRHPTMTALLVELRPRRRRRGVLGVVLGAAGLSAVAWSYSSRTPPEQACVTTELSARAWGPASITATENALLQSPHGYAATTWQTLHGYLEGASAEWEAQVRDACEARWERHSESDLTFDRRMRCLRRNALTLDRALTLIQAGGPARALQIAYAIPRAGTCSEPGVSGDPLEAESAQHDEFRQRFEQAQLLAPAGQIAQAEQELQALASAVASTEDRVLASRITTSLASIAAHTRPADQGTQAAVEAVLSTERSGDDHSIAQALLILTNHYAITVGDIPRAEETIQRARAVIARTELTVDLERGVANADALIAMAAGDFAVAIEAFETVLEVYARTFGELHPNRFLAVSNLSGALQSAGRTSDALEVLQTHIAVADRTLGVGHPAALALHIRLGHALYMASRHEAARDHLEPLRQVLEQDGSMPSMAGDLYSILARVAGQLGEQEQERQLLKLARDIKTQHYPPGHPNVLSTDIDLAASLRRGGDIDGAVALGEQVVQALTDLDTPPPNLLVTARTSLGQGYVAQQRWSKARATWELALAMAERDQLGPDPQCVLELLLADLSATQERPDTLEHYQRARTLFSEYTEPLVRAEVLFGLAQHLEPRGSPPTDAALALAARAQAAIVDIASPESAELRARIESWRSP